MLKTFHLSETKFPNVSPSNNWLLCIFLLIVIIFWIGFTIPKLRLFKCSQCTSWNSDTLYVCIPPSYRVEVLCIHLLLALANQMHTGEGKLVGVAILHSWGKCTYQIHTQRTELWTHVTQNLCQVVDFRREDHNIYITRILCFASWV